MYWRRSTIVKYFLGLPLVVVLYSELFVYVMQPLFWPELECSDGDATCTKILFVADPQIQGELEAPPPLNYLFMWDSDRYLTSTFSVVLKHFRPDVVVYLGDLMDEGSVATMVQFHAYVKRLSNIFNINYPVTQIWLPGDNDIGGENEPIRRDKVEEFQEIFHQPPVIVTRNISFYKVNGITHDKPPTSENDDHNFKIVVSHYAVLSKGYFGQRVNDAIRPQIYFCAHEHKSKYLKMSRDQSSKQTHQLQATDPVLNIELKDWLYEIFVPTCSYRMGTNNIGFGVAILENKNQVMRYTVFWSPRRFPFLFAYLAVAIFIAIYLVCHCIAKLFSIRVRYDKKKGDDGLPLLHRI